MSMLIGKKFRLDFILKDGLNRVARFHFTI
jgi:hypothetical protein